VTNHSATLKVINTGSCAGAEVVQVYIASDQVASSIKRPVKELKGFAKVHLLPGECRTIEIPFNKLTTAFWDEVIKQWVCELGQYRVLVGTSSSDIRLEGILKMEKTWMWNGL
jgi:beta-glucosidase